MVKAIILCAGFGSRMQKFTENTPKPMLLINNRPLLEYTINNLVKNGVTDIGINLHYLAEKIQDYFGNGNRFNVNITYIKEDHPSGTAGGVKLFSSYLHQVENFFVIYGDIFTDFNFSSLLNFHQGHHSLASMVVHKRKSSNSIVEFDQNNRVTKFIERPSAKMLEQNHDSWVNSAIYCMKNEILDFIPKNIPYDFPKDLFPHLTDKKSLYAFPLVGHRVAIDTPDKYEQAKREIEFFEFK